jgi:hypothetical protein
MTAPILGLVDLNSINEQAREVRPGRALATLLAAVLFSVGWVVGKGFGVSWFAVSWAAVAARTGYRAARGVPGNLPSLETVLAENARLRAELARVT